MIDLSDQAILAKIDELQFRFGNWRRRQHCRRHGHDLIDRVETGWPKMRVCTHCGTIRAPAPVDGVGPPDRYRRER